MSQAVSVAGWVIAACGVGAAAIARLREARLAEAMARTAHELRGPLTAVRLGLELAVRGEEPRRGCLRAIELEVERAALALEDLESAQEPVARGRSRPAPEEWRPVDVAGLLADSVEAWQGAAAARGVSLRIDGADGRPLVRGQRVRLAQATGNLIANALEHGGGEVEVSWRVEAASVRIAVTDRGPGLPAPVAELARCGRCGWMLPLRRRPGSARGHGLAIAGAVAASHGGRLAAAPSEHGARLVLELPVAVGALADEDPAPLRAV